ncbi:MAG TPA: pyridoxal-phosphate dependent enzyme, partial [Actinomycetota bacterium]|nr:pyridoxal-phosphate dependent enzyme [Actinomycetota bacterium]
LGARRIVMPSAGNAGGAWSLYAARVGLPITVTMAESAPETNRAEVRVAGGELVLVDGTMADAARRAREIAEESGAFLAATFSEPYRLEGKKTAWLETFDRLGWRLPRTVVFPVGGGVALLACAKAAEEARSLGLTSDPPPRLVGVQPARCAPIVRAFEQGDEKVAPWEDVELTAAAGLRVPAPSEGDLVLRAVRASGGRMVAVPEEDLRAWVGRLARAEGVWACPEGAAAVAGAARVAERGELEGPCVVYNTGAGSKYAWLDSPPAAA